MSENPVEKFKKERKRIARAMGSDAAFKKAALEFVTGLVARRYLYSFDWLGRPIIQFPQDIVAMQEIIWNVKPDLIVETGIAHGGSLVLSASILELLGGRGRVVGIDVDIRKYNRREIERHPMFKRIWMIEGSSTAPAVVKQVYRLAKRKKNVVVFLDSSHTGSHVLRELELYSPLVSRGSYIVAFDTLIEFLPQENRPWGKGNSPKTAVDHFLKTNGNFAVDRALEDKLVITAAPGGFLRRMK